MLEILLKAFGLGWLLPVPFETLSPEKIRKLQAEGELLLLDVRKADEWEQTGLPKGSLGLTFIEGDKEFAKNVASLCENNKSKPIALSCHAGHRSAEAAGILAKAGFGKLYSVDGGIEAWKNAGLPIQKMDIV